MKICASCKKHFTASSNHRDCPSCRYHKSKTVICFVCSVNKHSKKYRCCSSCVNKLRGDYGKGRYKKNGYVMIFHKGHPRAGKKGYVFEHIVVMENLLGRHLYVGENIHHKNGIKDDNRIENLELWIKPQPTGIRARDAVEWAQKILDIYGPVFNKIN